MRKTMLVVASVATAMLVASGIAWAATIRIGDRAVRARAGTAHRREPSRARGTCDRREHHTVTDSLC